MNKFKPGDIILERDRTQNRVKEYLQDRDRCNYLFRVVRYSGSQIHVVPLDGKCSSYRDKVWRTFDDHYELAISVPLGSLNEDMFEI